ncbi:hypothetical protein ABZS81_26995 [Streptomyces sp. NPDC005318]|uniref:hypothetical protein n=1 Tax=Streptomyces sp. NPDC005318 TaxID=3157031 RepID=UPI0033B28C65
MLQNLQPKPEPAEIRDERSTHTFGDAQVSRKVEPPVGLTVQLRGLGAQVRLCAPPECMEQPVEIQSR